MPINKLLLESQKEKLLAAGKKPIGLVRKLQETPRLAFNQAKVMLRNMPPPSFAQKTELVKAMVSPFAGGSEAPIVKGLKKLKERVR